MPDDQNTTPNTPTQDSSPTMPSDTTETAPEAQNAPTESFTAESTNSAINKGDAEISQIENEPKTLENPENTDPQTSEPQTAQIPANEPFENTQDKPSEMQSNFSFARELLIKARNVIQFRKRKKLDRIMEMFTKQNKITNDEVEKFLHVSDATSTRYLSILENEGKIKQVGKTGKAVSYLKM